ncbi:MAG: hypothetical protein KGQ59_01565, partial [Bdellovibrionales bacterium]|nr:hypothetical protein [Bdellovibrionales bacterium]
MSIALLKMRTLFTGMTAERFGLVPVRALLLITALYGPVHHAVAADTSEPTFEDLVEMMAKQQSQSDQERLTPFSLGTQELLADMKRTQKFFEGSTDKGEWEGFNKSTTKQRMDSEKNPARLQPSTDILYDWSRELATRAQEALRDSSLPVGERFEILKALLTQVIMPLRSATAIQGERAPEFADRKFFESLVPKIPIEMLSEQEGYSRQKTLTYLEALGYRP